MIEVSYLGILLAAVASMIIGSIWYGPLFGKKFMALMEFDKMSPEEQAKMKKGMVKSYIGQFIASLVMFYVLAHVMYLSGYFYGYSPLQAGLCSALWVWVGFVVPVKFGDAIWGGKMGLFWINIGSFLLTLLAAGATIGAFQ